MKKRREVRVRNEPYIYKIEIFEDGKWVRKCFRVQRKVRLSSGTRKTLSEQTDTLSEARRKRDSLQEVTAEDVPQIQHQKRSLKFVDVFKRFLNHKKVEANLQPTTLQKYEQTSRHFRFFEQIDFHQIDAKVVDAWINFLNDPDYLKLQKNSRINYRHEFDLFRGVVNYFVEFEDEEYRSPVRPRHSKRLCRRPRNSEKEIRFLEQEQQDVLLVNLKALTKTDRYLDLARLMLVQMETGLRIGEVTALQKEQLNFTTKEVYVDRHLQWDRAKGGNVTLAKGTKGGRSRMIYMSQLCMWALKLKMDFDPKAKVFSNSDGSWLQYRQAQAFYDRQFKAAGAHVTGTHTMRHTFAVNFLRRTKDIHALQKLLGHADLTETQGYAKYSDESTRQAFAVFDGKVLDVDFQNPDSQSGSQKQLEI